MSKVYTFYSNLTLPEVAKRINSRYIGDDINLLLKKATFLLPSIILKDESLEIIYANQTGSELRFHGSFIQDYEPGILVLTGTIFSINNNMSRPGIDIDSLIAHQSQLDLIVSHLKILLDSTKVEVVA